MRNSHDIGGMLSFGTVDRTPHPKQEHEKVAFGLTLAAIANGFLRNVDENRYSKERVSPQVALNCSYYELWLLALEMNLVEHGVLSLDDIERVAAGIREGSPRASGFEEDAVLTNNIAGMIGHSAHPPTPDGQAPPRFAVGDLVRAEVRTSRRHTRLPVYAAGRVGRIAQVLRAHPLPDVVAHEDSPDHEWTYRVLFRARDLWGPDAGAQDTVGLDVWESYIDMEEQ